MTISAATCWADTFEWTNPVNGLYTTAGNWTNTTGVDLAPPNAGDVALFNEAGVYMVTLSTSPVASDQLIVQAGTVTFRENVVGGGIYNLTTGGADAQVTGGATLILGIANEPAMLNIGDDLSVQNGSQLQVLFGSDVFTNDFLLGTSGSGLTSTVLVDGVGSTLTRNSTVTNLVLGQNGATANLTLRNGAMGNINGGLILVSSGNASSSGNVLVESDADLELDALTIGASAASATPVGTLTVTGSGSTVTQTGASPLTLGVASGNNGVLHVNSGGVFTTGTGLTTVNATGSINVDSGTMNFGGNVTINGGSYTENQASSATRTFADNATITIQNGGDMTLNSTQLSVERGQSFVLDGATSTLSLEGSFTSLAIGSFVDGMDGTVTISNSAVLTVDAVGMRANSVQTSVLNLQAGGRLYVDGSSFFSVVGDQLSTGAAEINIDGSSSALVISTCGSVGSHGEF